MTTPFAPRQWSSRFAFLMAAIGSAVGLGNIWRFPYVAGENGGGAFILIYGLTMLAIALPILAAEILLGRMGHKSPINTMRKLVAENRAARLWTLIGWGGTIGAFVVLSYYAVIGGWALKYIEFAITGAFAGDDNAATLAHFEAFVADPWALIFWQTIFLGFTVFIVSVGVTSGIERAVVALMPLLFLLIAGLAVYATTMPGFGEAMRFMFDIRLSEVTPATVLAAIGQGFFSVSIALGAMMTYGAYLDRSVSIGRSAVIIALADTAIAVLAGVAIFPLVFTYGLEPSAGPGLTFITLPIAFGTIGGGVLIGSAFFLLLSIAAVTSAISLLEPVVAWVEEAVDMSRRKLAVIAGILVWILGFGTVLSFNHWSDFHPFAPLGILAGMTVFDVLDYVVLNIVMPTVGLLMSLFVGWVLTREKVEEALGVSGARWVGFWRFSLRFVAPLGVVSIFVANVLI
ncbi:sodium-dependent transporter [Parvibaculum sp.]|uniref:sodium-dependent transporter n=1 Tax=Parvibaculum sp. TaxID=2024848 RepID=UPI001D6FAC42|nr:sodium-dependent transporter [Parvibaculum sp.]MBX3490382.1 sodium-dependent transporter [Parvibaculum sp.]MCW5728239.1 sodium-dependent transporter [Parvibaculum sp.]